MRLRTTGFICMQGPQLDDQKSKRTSSLAAAQWQSRIDASAAAAGHRPKRGRTIRSLLGLVVGVPSPRGCRRRLHSLARLVAIRIAAWWTGILPIRAGRGQRTSLQQAGNRGERTSGC
jgi:hypothetical protein